LRIKDTAARCSQAEFRLQIVWTSGIPGLLPGVNVVNTNALLHYEAVTQTRVGRAGYHHGDLPNALADAATSLARRGGPEAVVLREAARQVGVSAAAAYRHYVGHGELLAAVKDRALEALANAMQDGLDGGERLADPAADAVRRFTNLGRSYVGFALVNPGLFHTAFCRPSAEGSENAEAKVTARIAASRPYQILSVSLDELVSVGLLDPARRAVAPIAFWAAVHGLATLLVDGPLAAMSKPEQELAIQRTLDILIEGIGSVPHRA
jgi:AcrR family transcriptional regulator